MAHETTPGPVDQIEALGIACLAYARDGKDKPAEERAQDARWLLAAISQTRDGASDQIKDELRRSIIDLRTSGWTIRRVAEHLGYASLSRIDQLLKGYTGNGYRQQRHAGTTIRDLKE